jgi:hypothetical protein
MLWPEVRVRAPDRHTPIWRRLCLGSAGMILFGVLSSGSSGTLLCDPDLVTNSEQPYSYRLRGDRCEGIYVEKVASTTLLVASYTESFEDDNSALNNVLNIKWPAVAADTVHLRANILQRKLYYRMDTVRPAGDGSYHWPTDLLKALDIQRHDIGLVGWTEREFGADIRRVYIPIRVRPQGEPWQRGTHELVVIPGREIEELYLSIAQLDVHGSLVTSILDGEPLRYGYYPAERPVVIPIRGLEDAGLWAIEIGARVLGGGVASVELWIDTPGRPAASSLPR